MAEQEAEVWIERDKWLDTIHSLSFGIQTHVLHSVQNNQLQHFMKSYVDNTEEVTLKYTDAFHSDPVLELRDTLRRPFFVTTKRDILFGKEYQKNLKQNLHLALEKQRKENVQSKVTFEKQLEMEYLGELDALFILQRQFLSGRFENENEDIFIISSKGLKQITHSKAFDGYPTFSPDGKTLVFESNRNGRFELYITDLNGNINQGLGVDCH